MRAICSAARARASCSTSARARSRGSPACSTRPALDGILISHLHPDHFIDLVSLRHYLRWEAPRGRRVRVIGPAGLADRIDALHAEPGFTAEALDVEVLQPGHMGIGGFEVNVARVTHTESSFGFRVAGDDPGGLGPRLLG